MSYKKYDIVVLDLNPPKGHVQASVRPAVVLQSNILNQYASTFIIAPLTTAQKKAFPSEFWIQPSKENGLQKKSRFLGRHITAIDRDYILKKIGQLDQQYYLELQQALSVTLDWHDNF